MSVRYVALLRAVNVAGHQVLKMAALRDRFYAAGATNVATYIQSGNVVFAHESRAPGPLLEAATGYTIFVRTARQLAGIVAANPFPKDTAHLHLMMLPSAAKVTVPVSAPEKYQQRGGDLYVYLPGGAGSSKLAAKLGKLGGTLRNWRTIEALLAMSYSDKLSVKSG